MNDDKLIFLDDEEDTRPDDGIPVPRSEPWSVLIVDDEEEVHAVTRLVLRDFAFHGRRLQLESAYSAAEAREILSRRRDFALILLDVVMESDDAGLQLVRYIRETLNNDAVRIILRTGQPGQAPEEEVIVCYDINDYKAKTELTHKKLFTTVVAALRTYEHIHTIDQSRAGLNKIVDSSSDLHRLHSMQQFANGVLTQLAAFYRVSRGGILCAQLTEDERTGQARRSNGRTPASISVFAGSGCYEEAARDPARKAIRDDEMQVVQRCLLTEQHQYAPHYSCLFIRTPHDRRIAVYMLSEEALDPIDRSIIEVFCSKISVGFDNVQLYEQLRNAHRATVVALAGAAEFRDTDTGDHVMRVATITEHVARTLHRMGHYRDELNEMFLDQVGTASILHDIGKVSTPDHILLKPAKLEQDEWAIMQQHVPNGANILAKAMSMVDSGSYLVLGKQIAEAHHERFDGSGYPLGLSGTDIPLAARIVAVADVFDALTNERPYKKAWPMQDAIDYIHDRAGSHFDPLVVEAFLAVMQHPESWLNEKWGAYD